MNTLELKISGMTCSSCVASVTRALQRVPGVGAVDVDLARGTARVEAGPATTPALLAALEDAGYGAAPLGAEGAAAPASSAGHGGCGGSARKGGGCCCR